jgi:hypothetical protein
MQMGVETRALMSITESPGERKLTQIKNENDVRRDLGLTLWTDDKSPIANPIKPGIRIGIYQSRAGNMDEGWTRYVFDSFNVPYQSLRDFVLDSENLRNRFDAIVLPSDRTREPADRDEQIEGGRGISDTGFKNLGRFVDDGGTLICFDGSCGELIKKWKLPLRNVLEGLRSSDFYCPGSILSLKVDTTDPIAQTMSPGVDAYFINSSAFEAIDIPKSSASDVVISMASGPPRIVARYDNENLLRSGWLRGEDKINDRIALAEVPAGKGRIVLFAFRPQHRGQTWGTFPFIWNAINLGR